MGFLLLSCDRRSMQPNTPVSDDHFPTVTFPHPRRIFRSELPSHPQAERLKADMIFHARWSRRRQNAAGLRPAAPMLCCQSAVPISISGRHERSSGIRSGPGHRQIVPMNDFTKRYVPECRSDLIRSPSSDPPDLIRRIIRETTGDLTAFGCLQSDEGSGLKHSLHS